MTPRLLGLWYWDHERRAFVPYRPGTWYFDDSAGQWLCVDEGDGADEFARRLDEVCVAERYVKYALSEYHAERIWRQGHG